MKLVRMAEIKEAERIIFKGRTTEKNNERHEFNQIWVEGDLIVSGGKYYIHPRSNKVRVTGEIGKIIIMHEIIPETLCMMYY